MPCDLNLFRHIIVFDLHLRWDRDSVSGMTNHIGEGSAEVARTDS